MNAEYSKIQEELTEIKTTSIGLYNGKSGLLLCHGLLAEKNTEANTVARSLLQELTIELETVNSLSFSSGLSGIGWAIAYLNNIIDLPSPLTSFLDEFDDFIYKSIAGHQINDFSLETGLTGKGVYLYQRLKSQKEINFYRRLALEECLVLLAVEIKQYLYRLFMSHTSDIITIGEQLNILHSFNLLHCLKDLKMNPLLIENTLYEIKENLAEGICKGNFSYIRNSMLLYNIAADSEDNEMLKWCNVTHMDETSYNTLRKVMIKLLSMSKQPFWFLI